MRDPNIKISLATLSADDRAHWELVVENLAVADEKRFGILWRAFIAPLGKEMEAETRKRLASLNRN